MQEYDYDPEGDYKIIFLLIVVATVAELLDSLLQLFNLPIPNNSVTFTIIILFFILDISSPPPYIIPYFYMFS